MNNRFSVLSVFYLWALWVKALFFSSLPNFYFQFSIFQ